jgi:phosphohistidine swiveling domain-containing protein
VSGAATRRPQLATILAGLCVLTLVVGLVLGFWLRDRAVDINQTKRSEAEVVQAAQRFTITWNTMDPEQAEQYVEQIDELVTDEFKQKAFGGETEQAAELIREGGITSDAEVLVDKDGIPLVGLSVIDPNSAVVMVVADSNRQVNGQRAVRHWRWQLELVKEDDEWLVNDLTTV